MKDNTSLDIRFRITEDQMRAILSPEAQEVFHQLASVGKPSVKSDIIRALLADSLNAMFLDSSPTSSHTMLRNALGSHIGKSRSPEKSGPSERKEMPEKQSLPTDQESTSVETVHEDSESDTGDNNSGVQKAADDFSINPRFRHLIS